MSGSSLLQVANDMGKVTKFAPGPSSERRAEQNPGHREELSLVHKMQTHHETRVRGLQAGVLLRQVCHLRWVELAGGSLTV